MFEHLFQNLMNLCENTNTGFYFVDHFLLEDQHLYRTFSYRLSGSYSNWLLPDAMNCRGTMFRQEGDMWKLVCLPMPKCFRLRENPIIMEQQSNMNKLDFFLKLDGSLISTFVDANGHIRFKSKTSLTSPQSKQANLMLSEAISEYDLTVEKCLLSTFNFELCSNDPNMRIVVPYDTTKLTLLNYRNHNTGIVVHNSALLLYQQTTITEVEQDLAPRTDIEGVIGYDYLSDVTFKMKTPWYDELHNSKSSFSYENVINLFLMETLDDFRSLHFSDIGMMQKVDKIVNLIESQYNTVMSNINLFFEKNKSLARKDFAILVQESFSESIYLTLLMQMYSGKISNESKIKALSRFLCEFYKQHGENFNGFTDIS